MSYKLPAGLPFDPKLTIIAKKTGLARGDVLAVWVALIDHAAKARPRGSLAAAQPDEIAAVLECPPANVVAVIAALKDKNMISADNGIARWHRYQKLSTPRVRAHRARKQISDRQTRPAETESARLSRLRQDMAARRNNRPPAYADPL